MAESFDRRRFPAGPYIEPSQTSTQRGPKRIGRIGAIVPGDDVEVARELARKEFPKKPKRPDVPYAILDHLSGRIDVPRNAWSLMHEDAAGPFPWEYRLIHDPYELAGFTVDLDEGIISWEEDGLYEASAWVLCEYEGLTGMAAVGINQGSGSGWTSFRYANQYHFANVTGIELNRMFVGPIVLPYSVDGINELSNFSYMNNHCRVEVFQDIAATMNFSAARFMVKRLADASGEYEAS